MEKESTVRLEKLELQHKRLRYAFFILLVVMIVALCLALQQAQSLKLV